MDNLDKILFVSYFWPPLGGVPPQRSIRLATKLKEKGVIPTIITTSNKYGWTTLDNSLEKQVDDIRTIRTKSWGTDALHPEHRNIFKLLSIKTANVLALDYMYFWNFTLYSTLKRLVEEEGFRYIYNSSPPFSPLYSLYRLKKHFPDIVIIEDLRDSLLGYPAIFKTGIKLKNEFRLLRCKSEERRLLRSVDIFFSATLGIREEYLSQYSFLKPDNFHILTNGYLESDWEGIPEYKPDNNFKITYTGTFPLSRSPKNFLIGMQKAIRKNRELKDKTRIIFAGTLSDRDKILIRNFEYGDKIELTGVIEHKRTLELQSRSDVNLLIITSDGGKAVLTGKLFEYIRSGRPILTLVPEGESREVIRKGNLGVICNPDDPDHIAKGILQLFEQWQINQLYSTFNPTFSKQFSWDYLSDKFIQVLSGYSKGS